MRARPMQQHRPQSQSWSGSTLRSATCGERYIVPAITLIQRPAGQICPLPQSLWTQKVAVQSSCASNLMFDFSHLVKRWRGALKIAVSHAVSCMAVGGTPQGMHSITLSTAYRLSYIGDQCKCLANGSHILCEGLPQRPQLKLARGSSAK